jgi:hypothetical protein
MNDVARLVLEAWEKLGPTIMADPHELADGFEQSIVRRPVWRKKYGRMGVSASGRCAPDDHVYRDDVQLFGWRWVCPGCRKEVRTIYYPFAANTLFDFLGYDPGRARLCRRQSKKYLQYDVDDVQTPPGTFACRTCHRVRGTSRTSEEGWNQVVSHLTRGMLFGHEVEKPQWYRPARKNVRCRKMRRVAGRREAVFVRLMNGWTYEQIALDLMMSKHSVVENVRLILKQEGVKNRREFNSPRNEGPECIQPQAESSEPKGMTSDNDQPTLF